MGDGIWRVEMVDDTTGQELAYFVRAATPDGAHFRAVAEYRADVFDLDRGVTVVGVGPDDGAPWAF